MNKPLLTIAIPTWNRVNQLNEALKHILPQIELHAEIIQFIISDNASTDNTLAVVNSYLQNYPKCNIQLFEQKENTGFYGNFQKCLTLGRGKYFWLLSDDDYVLDGVVDVIIDCLKKEDIGAVFLNDWTYNLSCKETFKCEYVNKINYLKDKPFRHSLISSVIYIHTVNLEDEVFKSLKGNALIGYAVYLKAIHKYENFAILRGNSLMTRNDQETRFNALKIFTLDLSECLKIAYSLFSNEIVCNIANSFLSSLTSKHLMSYIQENSSISKKEIFGYFKYFQRYKNFWIYIMPLIITPRAVIVTLKRIKNAV